MDLGFESEILKEFVNQKTINEFIKKHQKNIQNFAKNRQVDFSLYEKTSIPFIFIYQSLVKLKNTIENIEELEGKIAKIFIQKEIKELKKSITTPYDNTLLFKSYSSFIKKVIDSLENDNLENFPIINEEECQFKEALTYPKAQMILQTQTNIKRVNKLHSLLHKSANALYIAYIKKDYPQSYFMLKNLKEFLLRFIKLLSELYFNTIVNIEERFFSTAYKIHQEKDIFLTIIDIRNLKNFNLIYGERIVNQALKIINKRLQSFLKQDYKNSLIIKAESADFFMLNINYTHEHFSNLINSIYKELSMPIHIHNVTLNLPIIIASTQIKRSLKIDKDLLIHSLILLKEHAKEINQNIYIASQEELEDILTSDKENFIIEKLNNKEVDVVFQPIFKTENKELFSLEVLGRIKDRDKLLPAGMFIDKIYELNLIEKFDSLILEKLIEKEEDIKKITDKIFLNISFQSLLNPDYMQKLKKFLEIFNIEVVLELTEQKFVSDLNLIKEIYDKYKIKFAVDDFGTGYSSLHLVVELIELGILKILKIDGSLIKDLEHNENLKKIVSLISKLGNDFNLLTVAEFVENREILNFLKENKISLAQGYYLSKPKTIEELLEEKDKFEETKRKNQIYKLIY